MIDHIIFKQSQTRDQQHFTNKLMVRQCIITHITYRLKLWHSQTHTTAIISHSKSLPHRSHYNS